MNLTKSSQPASGHAQLVDAVMDGYETWRKESGAVAAAYQNWRVATRYERALAFAEYLAALDREEQAASAYRLEQVGPT